MTDRHTRTWRVLRDSLLLVVGIFMLIHETLRVEARWPVMMVALVLVGLVPALRLDELLKR